MIYNIYLYLLQMFTFIYNVYYKYIYIFFLVALFMSVHNISNVIHDNVLKYSREGNHY